MIKTDDIFRMRYTFFWLAMAIFLGSCTINKDILFKTPNDYEYSELPDSLTLESKIKPNNFITMNFFTGNGHILVEQGIGATVLTNGGNNRGGNMGAMNQRNMLRYLIDKDGTAKLPVLGRIKLEGLSIREAESLLEDLYSEYYNEPYILLTVNNNRVIVSPGSGGRAQVINLINANTTLMEALASAGGIDDRGIASKIKLIRENEKTGKREVFLIDLSTIEGVNQADMIVQPNDIIYVEPLPLLASELLREITPVITLITTAVLLLALVNN